MTKSSLFTQAKIPTSFGRKSASRGTIKANSKSKCGTKVVTTSLSDSSSRSAKMRQIPEESMSLADETNKDKDKDKTFMAQTVQFFPSEFLKKELQKRNYLRICMVEDKIASTTRRCDRLTDRYYRMKKGPEAQKDLD
jgi:hypothetical protein